MLVNFLYCTLLVIEDGYVYMHSNTVTIDLTLHRTIFLWCCLHELHMGFSIDIPVYMLQKKVWVTPTLCFSTLVLWSKQPSRDRDKIKTLGGQGHVKPAPEILNVELGNHTHSSNSSWISTLQYNTHKEKRCLLICPLSCPPQDMLIFALHREKCLDQINVLQNVWESPPEQELSLPSLFWVTL